MKKNRLLVMLTLALSAGGLAAYLTSSNSEKETAGKAAPQVTFVKVAVATRDIPVGSLLNETDLKLVDLPSTSVPTQAVRDSKDAISRGVVMPIFAGEILMQGRLAPKEAGSGIPVSIPEGMRAISVKVDEIIGVAGFVVPGTVVDVLATLSDDGESGASAHVVLQNVKVLAAGQEVENSKAEEGDGKKAKTVEVITLLVTPADAEKLVLAATRGKIQLALRNPLDIKTQVTTGATFDALKSSVPPVTPMERTSPLPVKTQKSPVRKQSQLEVESFNGSKKSTTNFEDSSK